MSQDSLYQVTNPLTGEVEESFPNATDDQVEAALAAADEAAPAWRAVPLTERCAILQRVAQAYRDRREELAAVIAVEMGKPLVDGLGEVDLSADIFAHSAEIAPEVLADEALEVGALGGSAVVRREPLGAILGVMPWNYPYYQVARFAAPNLLLGNTILLKHASQCPRSATLIEQIFRAAGLPQAAYQNLFASNEQIATLLTDPRLRGVSLTGSERAGSAVGELAGRNLKKAVLELGGSDPFVVLPDADLDKVIPDAVLGRFENSGQACNAAKRFIVVGEIYDEFLARFSEAVRALRVGDPLQQGTEIGPLSSQQAARGIHAQVEDAIDQGAVAVAGGQRPEGPGAFVTPTVLTGVTPQMRAWGEEIFGPVAVVHHAADEDTAVAIANDTPFGLGASVHSASVPRALALADRLASGMVSINEAPGSAAELPFGGVKGSGFGRELGRYGFEEFCNHRLVRIGG